ncbi:DnaJ C-terminal domain-containing protein, partial [Caenispirillum salinarum]|uniref:DnaJ C-terminal domain-containing protein n=1 Tax=Caenispirillum salinarum TaxID=859058 RepID=UPI0005B85D2E
GQGRPGREGGPAGDALVSVHIRPHPLFTRQGDDVQMDLPIGLDEAVLGARVEVPTIHGRVRVTVPKGASSGHTLRLRGKGIRRGHGPGHGDQLVRLRIVLPPEVDEDLTRFMEDWRTRHPFDPRARMKGAAP